MYKQIDRKLHSDTMEDEKKFDRTAVEINEHTSPIGMIQHTTAEKINLHTCQINLEAVEVNLQTTNVEVNPHSYINKGV